MFATLVTADNKVSPICFVLSGLAAADIIVLHHTVTNGVLNLH